MAQAIEGSFAVSRPDNADSMNREACPLNLAGAFQ